MDDKVDWLEFIATSTGNDSDLIARVQQVAEHFPEPRRNAVYEAIATAGYDKPDPDSAKESSYLACYMLDLSAEGLSGLDDGSFEQAVTGIGTSANIAGVRMSQRRLASMIVCLETVLKHAPQLRADFEPLLSGADNLFAARQEQAYGRGGAAEMDEFSKRIIATLRDYAAKTQG